jgi:hypothetical protein
VLKFNNYYSIFVLFGNCLIMNYLDLKDSSRKLLSNYIFNFTNNLYLILHTNIETFVK